MTAIESNTFAFLYVYNNNNNNSRTCIFAYILKQGSDPDAIIDLLIN